MSPDERRARSVIAFAAVGHCLFHIVTALLATVVLVLAPIWGASYSALIALWTLGALLLGLGAPFAGWIGDRFGEARTMVVMFLGLGAATVLCGLANGPNALHLGLALMGLFGAIYHPVGTSWVVKHASKRGRAIARVGVAGSLGVAAAAPVAGVLADAFGWRAAFIVPGVITIAAGLALAGGHALRCDRRAASRPGAGTAERGRHGAARDGRLARHHEPHLDRLARFHHHVAEVVGA
jgi:FSR family fosmidomycin resistance protein-like MFS transporter